MRQKVILVLTFIGLILVLIGLNAFSFSQKERPPESESDPNRSTFNSGTTGSQAFFTLLAETGRMPVRWQEPPSALLPYRSDGPGTFVVIGPLRRSFTEAETSELLLWVHSGGQLVVIDRQPPEELVQTTINWKVEVYRPAATLDEEETLAKPVQPTLLTAGVNSVRLSPFAGMVMLRRLPEVVVDEFEQEVPSENYEGSSDVYRDRSTTVPPNGEESDPHLINTPEPTPYDFGGSFEEDPQVYAPPPPAPALPTPVPTDGTAAEDAAAETMPEPQPGSTPRFFEAPVVHMRTAAEQILAEVPYGNGRITFLSDPFVVSNVGIRELDNAQLAVNVVRANSGTVVFDEYHHGYGSTNNRLLEYFSGTPVISIFLQLLLVIGFVLFTQSRRFARVVPEPEPNRLSRLEYVLAMAELQHRTKAFDLAIENIYTDFRRRASRLFGVDATSVKYTELAEKIAGRTGGDAAAIGGLLFECEDAIRGEPVSKRKTVHLVEGIRSLEKELGLRRSRGNAAGGI